MTPYEIDLELGKEYKVNTTKGKIIELLRSTERPFIESLINHMENNGFFTAPCSSQFHLCKDGGLSEHSLNVFNMMHSTAADTGFLFRKGNVDKIEDSIIISALLHDLGKMGQFGKPQYTENYLVSGVRSSKKPFETNKTLLSVPHEIRSIQIASQYIELTEEESFAILHHNGMYSALKYELQGKETPLQMLLHFSDMWCSRVIEKEVK